MHHAPTPGNSLRHPQTYTVSTLNNEVKALVESGLPMVWVEGEVSNLARPSSGHLYFTLKDNESQVRCALFRAHRRASVLPANGDQVLVKAKVSIYSPRGDYQLIVERLVDAGDGALRRAFESLKRRLLDEGMFANEHKKRLPALPRQIGVVTSASGAAIHDILTILAQRFPAIPVVIYPVTVQGETAPQEISAALDLAARRAECDVIIVARGGGSLEDLWAFNEEVVARAIFACPIPVVSGVGHEVDSCISDFVADYRAATPSAAAAAVSPDQTEFRAQLDNIANRLSNRLSTFIREKFQQLSSLDKRLQPQNPGKRLLNSAQRLDDLEIRAKRALSRLIRSRKQDLDNRAAQLQSRSPLRHVKANEVQVQFLNRRLLKAVQRGLEVHTQKFAETSHALENVSPLATLSRGYAIVRSGDRGKIIRSWRDVRVSENVETRLGEGRLICKVENIHND